MNQTCRFVSVLIVVGLLGGCMSNGSHPSSHPLVFSVDRYGARGDGATVDTPAINAAIDAASKAGGGTVYFPSGQYLSASIHLKSDICLYLDAGAVIVAADPTQAKFDPAEPNESNKYQDFGHTHWHNSLIWGENLENVSILGPGKIYGKGLVRGRPKASGSTTKRGNENPPDETTQPAPTTRPKTFGYPNEKDTVPDGYGNKAIALKLCRNVILRDVTIAHGGHFAILATGVDNLTIDNLKIDTNRDGMDIDCCHNVRVSNCFVNSPADDGICPKSSLGLGYARTTENLTITNCQVSGFEEGTLLDGTYKPRAKGTPTGRIKLGTESNGGFKNITISNCVFDHCQGLALETVDGALLEDITVNNITMRDISSAPIFLRLGTRLRGPAESTQAGTLQRIIISNVVCYNSDPRYGCIISGVPGSDIKDVHLRDIHLNYRGGGTKKLATSQPAEKDFAYPEPKMFGDIPAYGFYIRHVDGIDLDNISVTYQDQDQRSPFILDDVKHVEFTQVKAQHEEGVPTFRLKNVNGFETYRCAGVADMKRDAVESEQF